MLLLLDPLFSTIEDFTRWLRGLGVLRVFWAKPFNKHIVLKESPLTLLLYWISGRKYKHGLIVYLPRDPDIKVYSRLCRLSREYEAAPILLSNYKSLAPGYYDRQGVVYFYDTKTWRGLKPNRNVSIKIYREPSERVLETLIRIQFESWSFYKPPPMGDKVFIAYIGEEPVGAAYFNNYSFNVDFGVHVRRGYWRQHIGTRILYEVTRYAKEQNAPWISVVRVFRGVEPRSSDRRAMNFYDANSPLEKLSVYRLYCNMLS